MTAEEWLELRVHLEQENAALREQAEDDAVEITTLLLRIELLERRLRDVLAPLDVARKILTG